MEWYKHDTSASNDAKIKKLVLKYGATGYAVYFHCLELIAGDINANNLTFQLEHDSEIIADNLKITGTSDKSGIEIVENIMRYILDLGLFQSDGQRIYCYKLLKRLDTSMTSNPKFRALITKAKQNHDTIMIPSCSNHDTIMQDKNRIDKIRGEEKRKEEGHIWLLNDIIKMIDFWNDSKYGLPKYPKSKYKTGVNIPDVHDLLKNLSFFNREQISQSIINYSKILNDTTYKAFPTYPTAISFLIKGIESYYDDAKPFDRCLKSGEIKKKKIDDKRQKNRPSHCKQCETKINEKNTKISISTMQCRECETIYKWNGHEWIIDK